MEFRPGSARVRTHPSLPPPAVHADDFAFLSLCFFLWKVGVVVSTSLARREDGVKWCA